MDRELTQQGLVQTALTFINMSKYNINADYPELFNEKERALVQKQLSQRSVYLHSVAAETLLAPRKAGL